MTNALRRIPGRNFSEINPVPAANSPQNSQECSDDAALQVIKTFPMGVDLASIAVQFSPSVHREARIRVIQRAVEDTLENPQHPYYGVGAKHREQMRRWITEAVVRSHLLQGDCLES